MKAGDKINRLTLLHPCRVETKKQRETGWVVACDCGQAFVVRAGNLKRQKSCGCATQKPASLPVVGRLKSTKYRAAKNNRSWDHSDDEAIALLLGICRYCGLKGTEAEPLGIDRLDSSRGYTKLNSVSCCGRCNKMKLDSSEADFLAQVRRIDLWHP